MAKDFDRILYRNEFRSLAGRSGSTIIGLAAILLFAILVLGMATAGLADLKKRMDNPFTNWISLPVSLEVQTVKDSIASMFEHQEVLDAFDLRGIGTHGVFFLRFMMGNGRDTIFPGLKGSTVDPSESILKSVLEEIKGNLVVHHGNLYENPCGLIVTTNFLASLGYPEGSYEKVRKVQLVFDSDILHLDVLAVVRELPGLNDFYCTAVLKNLYEKNIDETGFIRDHSSNIFPVVIAPGDETRQRELLLKYFEQFNPSRISPQGNLELQEGESWRLMNVIFPLDNYPDRKELVRYIQNNPLKEVMVWPYTEYNCATDRYTSIEYPSYFAFHFRSLDKIREFQDMMINNFGVQITMQQIESAENFALVSALTWMITLVLFGFALLSIGFYISSLIRTHLQQIIPNLGTLKAFGIRNVDLIKTYMFIIGAFCVIATLAAYIISLVAQFLLKGLQTRLQIEVLNWQVALGLVIIALASLIISRRTTRKIIVHTPGDLVYNRI